MHFHASATASCWELASTTYTLSCSLTFIPEDVRDEFLADLSERYTPQAYSLLHNNCNNFANELANLLVGEGIPEHITGLPDEVLATPFGQMILPMLQGLEQQLGSVQQQRFVPHQPHPHAQPAVINAAGASSAEAAQKQHLSETLEVSVDTSEAGHQAGVQWEQVRQRDPSDQATAAADTKQQRLDGAESCLTHTPAPETWSQEYAVASVPLSKTEFAPGLVPGGTALAATRAAADLEVKAEQHSMAAPALEAASRQLAAATRLGMVQEAEARLPAAPSAFDVNCDQSASQQQAPTHAAGKRDAVHAGKAAPSAGATVNQRQPPARSAAVAAAAAAAERRAQGAHTAQASMPNRPGFALGEGDRCDVARVNCEDSVGSEFERLIAAGQMGAEEAAAVAARTVAAGQVSGLAETQA